MPPPTLRYRPTPTRNPANHPQQNVTREKGKLRLGQSECSHIIRPLALNTTKMAQDVVSGQGFRVKTYQLNVSPLAATDAGKSGSSSRSA